MKIAVRLWIRSKKLLLTLSLEPLRGSKIQQTFIMLEETIWVIDNTTYPLQGLGLSDVGTSSKKKPQIHDKSKAKKPQFFQIATKKTRLLSTNTAPKHKTPPFICWKVMSMVTRPPIKNGHKHASGHITVRNWHSWIGYLTIGLCENDCKGIENPWLDCQLSRD